MEVAETDTSFLTPSSGSEDTCWNNVFSYCSWSNRFKRCLSLFFDNVGISTRCKGAMATTPFLTPTMPKTSLVVLILFTSLALVGKFPTRHNSRERVGGLIFPKVLFLAGLCPRRHFESISQVLERGCINVFASTLTAFSMTSFSKSSSRSQVSKYARIEGLRISLEYQIIISSFGVVAGSKFCKTVCKCSRCAAQSKTSSNCTRSLFWSFPSSCP